jgi:RNA-directed DNA polymerase
LRPGVSNRLTRSVPIDKKVLRDWLKAGYVESEKLFPTEAALAERFGRTPSALNRFRVRVVRYADDFIIAGNSKGLLEKEVKPLVEAFLAERGLQLSKEKTTVTHISEGFDFLGENVRKYDGELLIKPSAKNVKAFLNGVPETIRVNRSAKQETLINLLNPTIRGWVNYHRHVVARRRTRRRITTSGRRFGAGRDAAPV